MVAPQEVSGAAAIASESISSLEDEQRMALKPDLTMGSSGSSALLLLIWLAEVNLSSIVVDRWFEEEEEQGEEHCSTSLCVCTDLSLWINLVRS